MNSDIELNIKSLYYDKNKSFKLIGDIYGVSDVTIGKIFKNNGWTPRKPFEREQKIFNKQKVVDMYNNNISVIDIAKSHNSNVGTIYEVLHEMGVSVTKGINHREHSLNEEFFEEWTPLMAYWLGYLCADGCVSKDNQMISLSSKDEDVLLNFINDLESDYKIKQNIRNEKSFSPGTIQKYVNINSAKIKNSLINLKFNEFKKGGIELIKLIPDDLFSHWLRGMTDGDGTISIINEKGKQYPTWRLVDPFMNQLEYIGQIISKNVGISNLNVYNSKTIYVLVAKKKKGIKIMEYMYKNNVRSMKRKRNKFETIISSL